MAIKKSDLYSSIWASCDELRGGMDASQYKDYVLFMLFIKYITDKYGNSSDFAPPVTIPKGASFKDMIVLKGKSDIGDKINTQIIQPLIDAKAALLDDRTMAMTFGAFMAVYRSPIGELASYLFQSDVPKRQINEHLGATISQITNKSLNSFRIPVSPLDNERRAIAAALSDVDALLRGLDRLIAKKRDLKQAAMQQLLTGETRLPGFHGEWEMKALAAACSSSRPGSTTPSPGSSMRRASSRGTPSRKGSSTTSARPLSATSSPTPGSTSRCRSCSRT